MIIDGTSTSKPEEKSFYSKLPMPIILSNKTEQLSEEQFLDEKQVTDSEDFCSYDEPDCDLCNPMMRKHRSLPEDPTMSEKIKYAVSCPPHGKVGIFLTWVLVIPIVWGVLIAITGDEALPGGNIFSILCILILSQLGGYITSFFHLPPLLGMILVGIAARSVPGLEIVGSNINPNWSATLRKMALVVILIRAGLGLDPKALREMSMMVLRLGFLPNIIEMTVVAVISNILLGFPWLWSFMLGFIIAGVSPSVVVPCMINLSESGYGVKKGIPTLVIAGLSVDNVLSISGFGVLLGIIFSEGSIVWQALKGPIEVVSGLGYGLAIGVLLWYLPDKTTKGFAKFRFVLLFGAGLLAIFGSIKIGFGGAGPIGCLSTAFVAAIGWRKQKWMSDKSPIKKNFNFLWQFFLPLLFGLIGTEIKISALDGSTVGYGLVTLLISLTCRIVTSYFCVLGGNLNLKERIFVALAWLPKATIQAAVGSTALDLARAMDGNPDHESPEEILGKQVLTIAVLVILVAAPIGAAAIMLSGPKLLEKQVSSEDFIKEKEKLGTELECV